VARKATSREIAQDPELDLALVHPVQDLFPADAAEAETTETVEERMIEVREAEAEREDIEEVPHQASLDPL
jgi:hypothetical protein